MSETTSTGWRYKLGLLLFIVPIIIFILTPVVIPMLDLSAVQTASVIGVVLLTGEIVWFASIPLLGKDGFNAIKQKMFGWLKLKDKPVSKKRHLCGIILLLSSILTDVLLQIFILSIYLFLEKGQEMIFGITLDTLTNIHTIIQILTTLGILASLFILGGQFWEKIKQAFIWEEPDKSN